MPESLQFPPMGAKPRQRHEVRFMPSLSYHERGLEGLAKN